MVLGVFIAVGIAIDVVAVVVNNTNPVDIIGSRTVAAVRARRLYARRNG